MALTKELLKVLNNQDEPLPKRLRMANNAFNSADFYICNKEGLLLEWLSNIGLELECLETWNTLQECLISPHMKEVRQNDIRQDILSNIIKAISKRLKQELDPNLKSSVLECALSILRNEIFQQYFRHDIKKYSIFVSHILRNISTINEMSNIIEEKLIFSTKILLKKDCRKYFLTHTVDALVYTLTKFQDAKIFEACTKLVQRIVFPLNSSDCEEFLENLFRSSQTENAKSNIVFNTLINFYKKDDKESKIASKLIFSAFCYAYKNQKLLIYKFFILLLQIIGFNVEETFTINISDVELDFNVEKSLTILSEIFDVINTDNPPLDLIINDVSISNCIQYIVSSIIRLSLQPNIHILKIIKLVISIDPLVIDNILSEILPYVILGVKTEESGIIYINLMLSLYDMYLKLHRLDIFLSELLKSLKSFLYNIFEKDEPKFGFKQKTTKQKSLKIVDNVKAIFPENVVGYFHQCIILQPNKQVLSITKILVENLGEFVSDIQDCVNDSKKILFLQIVTEITTQFLSAVRVVEHITPEQTVREFIKDMNVLKDILSKLGTSLLKMEHNHLLMCSFLNIAYIWAEVVILFLYYKPIEDINLKYSLGNDNAASNITYIHNYLTAEQWSLVSQRIKNFGGQLCKNILQKLIIQKVRAIILLETSVANDIEIATMKTFTSDLDNNWSIILSETFLITTIIPKLENQYVLEIAECIIREILNTGKIDILKKQKLFDCRKLTYALLYACVSKINSLFKTKRKLYDAKNYKFFSTKVFKQIDYDFFITTEDFNLDKISDVFKNISLIEQSFEVDEKQFFQLFEIIKNIPVLFCPSIIQTILFSYILSICVDLNHSGEQNKKCFNLGETFLIGIINGKLFLNFALSFPIVDLFEMILNNLSRHHEILPFILGKMLNEEESAELFNPVVELLVNKLPERKYLDLTTLTINTINKVNRSSMSATHKKCLQKYKTKLCKYLVKKVLNIKKIEAEYVEPFALTLQMYLLKDTKGRLAILSKHIKRCLKYSVRRVTPTNAQGCLSLVHIVLMQKEKFNDLPLQFTKHAWRICSKKLFFANNSYFGYANTIRKIITDAKFKLFCVIVNDLSDLTMGFMKSGQMVELNNVLNLWNIIFYSIFNKRKQGAIYLAMCSLLEGGIVYLTNNHNQVFNEAFISLQIRLITNQKFSQNPNIIDIYFQTIFIIMSREYDNETLTIIVKHGYTLMDSLIKYRKVLMVDRIPSYLMLVRLFFKQVCNKSNTDLKLKENELKNMKDCAFLLEKLLRGIRSLKEDVSRVIKYLIADIINYYEKISLYPSVKGHITNGLYEVIDLCDRCSFSYLFSNLPIASTEIFKTMYENYKKYYKYTGKV